MTEELQLLRMSRALLVCALSLLTAGCLEEAKLVQAAGNLLAARAEAARRAALS